MTWCSIDLRIRGEFVVFYCLLQCNYFFGYSFCLWIERFNPKSLVCKTQLTTVGPKDLVHNPFKANTKTEAEIQVSYTWYPFFLQWVTRRKREKAIYISSKVMLCATHRFVMYASARLHSFVVMITYFAVLCSIVTFILIAILFLYH